MHYNDKEFLKGIAIFIGIFVFMILGMIVCGKGNNLDNYLSQEESLWLFCDRLDYENFFDILESDLRLGRISNNELRHNFCDIQQQNCQETIKRVLNQICEISSFGEEADLKAQQNMVAPEMY